MTQEIPLSSFKTENACHKNKGFWTNGSCKPRELKHASAMGLEDLCKYGNGRMSMKADRLHLTPHTGVGANPTKLCELDMVSVDGDDGEWVPQIEGLVTSSESQQVLLTEDQCGAKGGRLHDKRCFSWNKKKEDWNTSKSDWGSRDKIEIQMTEKDCKAAWGGKWSGHSCHRDVGGGEEVEFIVENIKEASDNYRRIPQDRIDEEIENKIEWAKDSITDKDELTEEILRLQGQEGESEADQSLRDNDWEFAEEHISELERNKGWTWRGGENVGTDDIGETKTLFLNEDGDLHEDITEIEPGDDDEFNTRSPEGLPIYNMLPDKSKFALIKFTEVIQEIIEMGEAEDDAMIGIKESWKGLGDKRDQIVLSKVKFL